MVWDPTYERSEGWLLHKYVLASGNELRIAARDIRREHTGVHANVSISLNWVSLAWTNFNIERDEDRVRLSNSTYAHLDPKANALDIAEFSKTTMKHALDLFCFGLWEEHVTAQIGGLMPGNPNLKPAQVLLGNYLLKEGGVILFAAPGTGKSYTAMSWAACVMYGIDTIWKLTDCATPLYINVERSASSMAARLAAVNQCLGLEPDAALPFLNARGRSLSDLYEAAKRTIAQESCNLVIYDSISRAGNGSMVADDAANRTMDMLNALTPSWLALAHSPRADDAHAYGSIMFDAAADLILQMKAQPSTDGTATGIGIQGTKANDMPLPKMAVHVFEWDKNGLSGIRRGRAGEFAELSAAQTISHEEQARRYLLSVGQASAAEIAAEFGWNRQNTSALLNAANWTLKIPVKTGNGQIVKFAVSERFVDTR